MATPSGTVHEIARAARPEGWWKRAVVYQVYPRSFADSDGDGVGDMPGIISKLDYLVDLGIDAVWLSPTYTSPQDDNGYDISDYQDIDATFGTLADMDALIAGLHDRGMKLVLDLVVNHTSDEHPWFVASRDPGSDKRDWYWWAPPREGQEPGTPGAEPYNWGSYFSGPAWQYDERGGEYYLHLFSRKQPDLNWENPEVRRAVYAMMRWWLDRGIDGFRMDVINLISKTLPLTDGPAPVGDLCYDGTLVSDGPRTNEFLTEMHAEVLAGESLLTVGECPYVTVDKAREYTDEARQELGMVFTFEHMGLDSGPGGRYDLQPWTLSALKKTLAHWQDGLAEVGWNSLYWNNHDQPRVVSRFGDDSPQHRVASAKTLGTVLHMLKGTPYVYQGEEIGMTNAGFASLEAFRDIQAVNFRAAALERGADPKKVLAALSAASRDNARTPMCWSDDPQAGFTTGTPWLPVNANYPEINAEAAVADPESVFHHYRNLIALRHDEAVVREGRFALLLPDDERIFAYTRSLPSSVLLVVANMSSEASEWPTGLPDVNAARLLLGTHGERMTGALRPWESRVLRLS